MTNDLKVADMADVALLRNLLDVNVVSMLVLNSLFLRKYKSASNKQVVNLTAPSAGGIAEQVVHIYIVYLQSRVCHPLVSRVSSNRHDIIVYKHWLPRSRTYA
jgi:hypothetical protein